MRILLLTRAGTGGAARHVLDVVRGLAGRHEITVLASPLEDPGYPDALERAGATVVTVPIRRGPDPAGDLKVRSILKRTVARGRPEVLHAHAAKPGILARSLSACPPVVYSPHGFYHHYPTAPKVARRAALRVERTLAGRTAVLALCANWEREPAESAGLGGTAGTVVIPNGVPLPEPLPAKERRKLRRELGVPEDGRLIVMAARLAPPKDPLTFLRAAPLLGGEFRLVLVGDGPLRDRCRELVAPNALLAGYRGDLPDILLAADAAVLCTRFEAAPYFPLEAMAAGLPVVATDLPATREILGEAGSLVPGEDPARLAEAIRILFSSHAPPSEAGDSLRRRAGRRYSEETMLASTEAAWELDASHAG